MRNARPVDSEFDALLRHLRLEDVRGLVYDGAEVERRGLELHSPGLYPAHLQDVVDECKQVVARHLELSDVLAHLSDVVPGAPRELDVSDDGVHRRADVVAHAREEGALRAVARLNLRLRHLELLLAPALYRVEVEDDEEGAGEERQLDDVVAEPLRVEDGHLVRHEVLLVAEGLGARRSVHLRAVLRLEGDDRVNSAGSRALRREPDPHEGREEYEDHDSRPDDWGASEPLPFVVLEHLPVEREADDAPEREHEIRLRGENASREVVRHKQQQAERDGHHRADEARGLRERVAPLARELPGRRGSAAVRHGRADARNVDRPSDDGAPEERDHQRNADDEEYRVAGRAVGVESAEPAPRREDVVGRKGVDEPAHRDRRADDPREDRREHRGADERDACAAERDARGGEGGHRVEP